MKVLREYYRAESKHSSSLLKVYRDLHFGIEQVDRQLREEKKISQLYNEMLGDKFHSVRLLAFHKLMGKSYPSQS